MDVFRTMVIPASLVSLARALGAGLSPGGAGMFTTGLSADGSEPATHYVSSGMIGEQFAACIASGDLLYAACVEAGATVALDQCNALVADSDVTDGTRLVDDAGIEVLTTETPFQAFDRLGLKLVTEE